MKKYQHLTSVFLVQYQNKMEQNIIFHLEDPCHNHLVQLPDDFAADQKLKHVVKGIVQMPLKHWQAWGIDHLSRKPVLGFDQPLSKEILPNVHSETPQPTVF